MPIGLDYSWFLIFALLTWSLATSYYPAEFRNWATAQYWVVGAVTVVKLFVSVLLHELGHSVMAMRYKIPVCSITLLVFGGVAQIGAEPPSATAEFRIAIAGPIVSFALAILFRLLRPFVGAVAPLLALVEYLAYINGLRRATLVASDVGRFIAYIFILVGVWRMFTGNNGTPIRWVTRSKKEARASYLF